MSKLPKIPVQINMRSDWDPQSVCLTAEKTQAFHLDLVLNSSLASPRAASTSQIGVKIIILQYLRMLQDALVFHFLKNDPTPNKLKMQGSKTGAKSKRVILSIFQKI